MLATIIGNTSLAVSIVVSIFMAGLALGSFFAARSSLFGINPLRAYGLLEALIGIYAAATPWTSHLVEALYFNAYSVTDSSFLLSVAIKAFLAALFLLLPAIAMGASLPILIRIYTPDERSIRASMLYAINTAGAVGGTLFAGYGLLPLLGTSKTIWLAASLNGAIGLIAFLVTIESRVSIESKMRPAKLHPAYWLSLLAGLTILSYEILWTRALSMFFGSSVYAFSTILAAFLLGIASGSRFYAKRIPAEADPFQFFSLIQFRIALSAILFLGIFMGLPLFLIALFETFYFSFPLFQIAQFLLVGCVVFYTTFLSGGAFPAAIHFFRENKGEIQTHVGYIYSFNTVGSILGSLLAGFFLIPYFGVESSIRLVLTVNLLIGLFCFFASGRRDNKLLAIAAASLIFLFILPPWNKSIYNGGYYAFAYKYVPSKLEHRSKRPEKQGAVNKASVIPSQLVVPGLSDSEWRTKQKDGNTELNLIYYGEGLTATVAVAEHPGGVQSLLINGKPEASNVPTGDMRTQLLLAHLPLLARSGARDALVIGLGSGVTAGALSLHNLRTIDCVEIEKKVAEAARFYDRWNFGIFQKPNFRLIFDDGRNFVQHAPSKYDVITSEPSNLWISGVANLFTREFFQAAKTKLRPRGVMCQWIHLYQISLHDIYVFLKTYQSVFPHLSIWVDSSDMLIIGSDEPLNPLSVQSNLLLNARVRENLEESAFTPSEISALYAGNERIIHALPPGIPLNTDDHPILEFSAPRSQFKNESAFIAANVVLLQKHSASLNDTVVK